MAVARGHDLGTTGQSAAFEAASRKAQLAASGSRLAPPAPPPVPKASEVVRNRAGIAVSCHTCKGNHLDPPICPYMGIRPTFGH